MTPSAHLYSHHLSPHVADASPEAAPLVEMNTTPLIDVLLVLIVMLIITIPASLQSVNLDMPSVQNTNDVPNIVVVNIDALGFVLWNGDKLVSMTEVNSRIEAAAAQTVQPEIHLQPSPDAPYSFVVGVLATAQKAGLKKVGVVK